MFGSKAEDELTEEEAIDLAPEVTATQLDATTLDISPVKANNVALWAAIAFAVLISLVVVAIYMKVDEKKEFNWMEANPKAHYERLNDETSA